GHEALQRAERKRHVADYCRLVTEKAVARQLELQRLGGYRVEACERPVPTAESGLNRLHQVKRTFVLAPDELALARHLEPGRAGLRISPDQPGAVNIESEEHALGKLLKPWIALQRLDRVA